MDIQKLTSHPVHLVDSDGNSNPTALVPFCSISDNYSAMGVKIDQIDVPVCRGRLLDDGAMLDDNVTQQYQIRS